MVGEGCVFVGVYFRVEISVEDANGTTVKSTVCRGQKGEELSVPAYGRGPSKELFGQPS